MNDPITRIAEPRFGMEFPINSDTRKYLRAHPRTVCRAGKVKFCVIHNQSKHHMRGWPITLRLDRNFALAERRCSHGVGHPDPDSMAYIVSEIGEEKAYYEAVHGCDGCCHGI